LFGDDNIDIDVSIDEEEKNGAKTKRSNMK